MPSSLRLPYLQGRGGVDMLMSAVVGWCDARPLYPTAKYWTYPSAVISVAVALVGAAQRVQEAQQFKKYCMSSKQCHPWGRAAHLASHSRSASFLLRVCAKSMTLMMESFCSPFLGMALGVWLARLG